jgi:putative FmdB family regulatory protein
MPIYTYQCLMCNKEFDEYARVDDYQQEKICKNPKCPGQAIKIISARGVVLSDTPSWLDDQVQGALLDIDSRHFRPIETRGQLKKHLKEQGICEAPKSGARWI